MNPSYEAVRLLPDEISNAQIVKAQLPVVFGRGGRNVQDLVRRERPDIVILVGQAGGRTSINVERVAINCMDVSANCPDNEGNAPQDEKIYQDGPDAYFATLPIRAMVKKMMDNGIPAQISNTAGTYVCNDVMYHLLHLLYSEFPGTRGGFIHVPYATIQNHPGQPSMTLQEISRGLKCSVEAAVENFLVSMG